jgi:predicted transcriptional regulator
MDRTIIQVGVPSAVARRYDELAEETGRGREDLLVEALEAYLARVAEDNARLEAAIAAAKRGEVVDAEVVRAEAEARLLERGMTREQIAAIRAEVFAEMEEAYGVSLCE